MFHDRSTEEMYERELRPIVQREIMSMPTTILDGESHEDARRRRFQEEAEIDARIAGSPDGPDEATKYRQERDVLLIALEKIRHNAALGSSVLAKDIAQWAEAAIATVTP